MSRVMRFKDLPDKLYQFFDKVSNPNQYEMTFLKKFFMSTKKREKLYFFKDIVKD